MIIPGVISQSAGGPPPPPLLDLYPGAKAAFSFRKLSTGYTGSCIQVRRSVDNALSDIGFDAYGNLDVAAIRAFVPSNGFGSLVIWYDQSGNNHNGSLGTFGGCSPNIIYLNVITRVNGKPAFKVGCSGCKFQLAGAPVLSTDSISVYGTGQADPTGAAQGANGIAGSPTTVDYQIFNLNADNKFYFGDGATFNNMDTGIPLNQGDKYGFIVGATERASNDREVFGNGVSGGINTTNYTPASFTPIIMSGYRPLCQWPDAGLNELVMYDVGHSAVTAIGIQDNMNQYYKVY